MEFLDNIDLRIFIQSLDIILDLAPQAIIVGLLGLSYFIVVYALIKFVEEAGDLKTRLSNVQSELTSLRSQYPKKRQHVDQTRKLLRSLRFEYKELSDFYEELRDIQIEDEKKSMEQERERDVKVRDFNEILVPSAVSSAVSSRAYLNSIISN